MSSPHEQQIQALQKENQSLRGELARYQQRDARKQEVRGKAIRIGWSVLVPLFDRQKVARNFARLANTVSGFAGPVDGWPGKEEVLTDARNFATSCVRFVVRRRLFFLLFTLVAATFPAIQIYLVMQQNEIIEQQNKLFRSQIYEGVARSMSGQEGNNQAAGLLLANERIEFLEGIVKEVFDPDLQRFAARQSVTPEDHLDETAQRTFIIRAVGRRIDRTAREGADDDELEDLFARIRELVTLILDDAADRTYQIFRATPPGSDVDPDLVKQVEVYVLNVGYLLEKYAQLARRVDEEKRFFADIRPLFESLAGNRYIAQSRLATVYRTTMEDFLYDLALTPELGGEPVDLAASGKTPEQALQAGLDHLRGGLGADALDWGRFEQTLRGQ